MYKVQLSVETFNRWVGNCQATGPGPGPGIGDWDWGLGLGTGRPC